MQQVLDANRQPSSPSRHHAYSISATLFPPPLFPPPHQEILMRLPPHATIPALTKTTRKTTKTTKIPDADGLDDPEDPLCYVSPTPTPRPSPLGVDRRSRHRARAESVCCTTVMLHERSPFPVSEL
ncbi:hypothetical protein HYDPIDRAFT_117445 [Hydnomerulius pinastri MD-312]|uniref:Uncharacterized protein n=1 Tax=Hydnomerulius pinastri MD-312 TaxID=994086 RepID=A0A0C9WAL3_9AGAM|nr:hypothetical protein HYDPIDRAFT_117445 [Hydnomerulius pinastri MD-312]